MIGHCQQPDKPVGRVARRCHPAHMTYVTHPPPPRRRRSRALLASGAVAGALVLVVAVVAIVLATRNPAPADRGVPTAAGASSVAAAPAAPGELRVSALLAKLGCGGKVIGTQLYSRETGRCTMNGGDVTLAVFDTDALRDQWVDGARQYGGNFVAGPRWAVMADSPDAAVTVAQKLGGKRL